MLRSVQLARSRPADLLAHDCICIRWAPRGEPWAWELERGKKTWRVPVRGPVTTNNSDLMRSLAVSGVGLFYGLEPTIGRELARGQLRVVLEAYAPAAPGLFLYFPSRAQVSPALKALVAVAREIGSASARGKRTSSKQPARHARGALPARGWGTLTR